jgi:site-specific recombinase XerD
MRMRRSPYPTVATPRVIRRLPTALSIEQIRRVFLITPMPYRLMLRWCLATGMRRLEVANLLLSDLPTPEQIAQSDDNLMRISILRKGSRELTVHVPVSLIEETQWFVLCDRKKAKFTDDQHVFLNKSGRPISRQSITREFRKTADAIGTDATLHHLRHTFAVHVLGILEQRNSEGEALNSIKTLQVMLGHASLESTEIYLQAMQTSSDAVMEALDFLYGASL